MAEVISQKGGRGRTMPPRQDLTPMVDLGFILITFFIYTTTIATPNVIDVRMPSNEHVPEPTVFVEESTITLMPVKDHRVFYYCGLLNTPSQLRETSMQGVREILIQKKKAAAALPASFSADAHGLHVLLKPNDDSKYEDLVALFDEMAITDVSVYALVDITPLEVDWIEKMMR